MRLRPALAVPAAGLVVAAAAAVAALRPRRVVVVGESMLPALRPGDRLLLLRLPPQGGAVVAVTDPRDPARTLLKRVAATPGCAAELPGSGRLEAGAGYVVLGDNPAASTDSAAFGPVPRHLIRGRAVYRYAPAGQAGPVPGAPRPADAAAVPDVNIGATPARRSHCAADSRRS